MSKSSGTLFLSFVLQMLVVAVPSLASPLPEPAIATVTAVEFDPVTNLGYIEDAGAEFTAAQILAGPQALAISRTDSLTEIPNRGAFDNALIKGLEICRVESNPISVLLIDGADEALYQSKGAGRNRYSMAT